MGKITSYLERGYGRIIRGSCKLITASNDADSSALPLIRNCLERRKYTFNFRKKLFSLHGFACYSIKFINFVNNFTNKNSSLIKVLSNKLSLIKQPIFYINWAKQKQFRKSQNTMTSLSRISKGTTHSARFTTYLDGNSPVYKYRNSSEMRTANNKLQNSKLQFRNVLKSRGNHSRISEDQKLSHGRIRQQEISQCQIVSSESKNIKLHAQNKKIISKKQLQTHLLKEKDNIQEFAKPIFLDQSKIFNLQSNIGNPELINKRQSRFKLKTQKDHQRKDQNFSKTSNQSFKFLKNQVDSQVKSKLGQMRTKSSRLSADQRIMRSSSNSSFSLLNQKQRKEKLIQENTNPQKELSQKERRSISKASKQKSNKILTFQQIQQQFQQSQDKIDDLTQLKWKVIEQKLMKNNDKSNKNQKNVDSKFSFSKAIAQKNIDVQIMDLIKSLRSLNLNRMSFTQKQLVELDIETAKANLQQKRSRIIEKALAQSMVQGQLLRKYFSGLNAKGLLTSNYKVGQTEKIQTSPKKKSIKESLKQSGLIDKPEVRKSVSNTTENKGQYKIPNQQDYEKYRYKHPNFKPNLQPLPKSAYQSQFFSYGNIKISDKFKQDENMIFPKTYALKNSTYRQQFKPANVQKFDIKQLDAYHNKFKDLDIFFFPNKRTLSQSSTAHRINKKSLPRYQNQLDYVKKLKTESMLDSNFQKQFSQRKEQLAKKIFLSQSRKEYENPQTSPYHFAKSQIKHKNLNVLKYDLKKKFKV